MKNHTRKNGRKGVRMEILFGDFVAAVCGACGQRGPRMVQWAVNQHIVRFAGGQHVVISEL